VLKKERKELTMGLTFIEGKVKGNNGKEADVKFLVDSGATYTLLALEHWKAIGLTAKRNMEFTLADGTTIRRGVSECYIVIPQGEGHTPVILGEEEDESLIGAITLEILGLRLNPFNRTLEPMKMMLA
jgi:predicted aspartyl protease